MKSDVCGCAQCACAFGQVNIDNVHALWTHAVLVVVEICDDRSIFGLTKVVITLEMEVVETFALMIVPVDAF